MKLLLMAIAMLTTSTALLAAQETVIYQDYENHQDFGTYQQTFEPNVVSQQIETPVVQEQVQTTKFKKPKTYKEAYQNAQNGDKPLLILVTADWCPPCQVMKKTTIPQLMQKDAFKDFHYATVDLDQEENLARQLIGNRGVPQIIMFEKQDGQWVRRYLKGIQTVQTVEAFFAQSNTLRTAEAKKKVNDTIEK